MTIEREIIWVFVIMLLCGTKFCPRMLFLYMYFNLLVLGTHECEVLNAAEKEKHDEHDKNDNESLM